MTTSVESDKIRPIRPVYKCKQDKFTVHIVFAIAFKVKLLYEHKLILNANILVF